jgi:hypothetical protein
MKSNLYLLFLLAVVSMFNPECAFAQTANPINLTLSPISIQLESKPASQLSSQIRIRNNGKDNESLVLTLGTFIADSTGENPKLVDATERDTFLNWLKFENSQVSIAPGEWKQIPFTIDVPPEAVYSYYYAIFVTRENENRALENAETVIKGSPAILVLLNIDSPEAKKEVVLDSFKSNSWFVESLPYEFEIAVKNTGNVHVSPFGNIFIDGQNKKDLAVLPVNPNSNVILPNTQREYRVKWEDGFPIKGDGFLGFEWDFSKTDRFRFGRYTAHVILVYDNGERDIATESTLTFWVIPWKILSGLLIVSLFALYGIWSILSRIIKLVWRKKEFSV